MSKNVLPDSRLARRPDLGSVMVDWPLGDGTSIRLEAVKIYCANCGVPYGYVPRENTTFAFWVCASCAEKHGPVPGTFAVPDDEFNESVEHEVRARFGRDLTEAELIAAARDGRLGPALEALARDSPYPVRK